MKQNRMEHLNTKTVMKLPEFRFWCDAILENNGIEMERILTAADTETVEVLVNGCFQLECINSETHPVVQQIGRCQVVACLIIHMASEYAYDSTFQALFPISGWLMEIP